MRLGWEEIDCIFVDMDDVDLPVMTPDLDIFRSALCLLFIPSGPETLAFGAARQSRSLPFFRLDFRRQQSVTVTVR